VCSNSSKGLEMRLSILIAVALGVTTASASALSIDPRCTKVGDPIGCTCAVQNGGVIRGRHWYSKVRTSDPANEKFVQCQIKAGQR
jgi:hypothetical protein